MKARPQGRRWRAALLATLVLSSLHGLSASAMGNPNERYAFDIPQGVAAWRLNDFGTQSGMQLLFNFEDMKGVSDAAGDGAAGEGQQRKGAQGRSTQRRCDTGRSHDTRHAALFNFPARLANHV